MKEEKSYRIQLISELLGTIPKDPQAYEDYVMKPEEADDENAATVEAAEGEDKRGTGFHKDENGLFIYNYMIKGFLKQAGKVLKGTSEIDVKNLRSKISDYVFVNPRRIYLNQNEPDGILQRPLSITTPQGFQRAVLAKSDYISAGKILEFTIVMIEHKELKWNVIDELLRYGELAGIGQFRNGGYGQFTIL